MTLLGRMHEVVYGRRIRVLSDRLAELIPPTSECSTSATATGSSLI